MKLNPELLRRYWLGECSPREKQQVENWLSAGESEDDYTLDDTINKDELRGRLREELSSKLPHGTLRDESGHLERSAENPIGWLRLAGIAACLILATFAGYYFHKPSLRLRQPAAAYREIKAAYGEKISLRLPDNTAVVLNAGSSIRFPERFADSCRHILLQGEAFFTVTKDPGKPFVVQTTRSNTRVLGTRFNLRDFSQEPASSITVEEGKVAFIGTSQKDAVILTRNDRAILESGRIQKSKINVQDFTDWRNNVLHFRNIPLADAVPEIERWYNVRIDLEKPEMGKLKIKGSFKNPSLTALMHDFSYLLNLRYRIKGNHVLLYQ